MLGHMHGADKRRESYQMNEDYDKSTVDRILNKTDDHLSDLCDLERYNHSSVIKTEPIRRFPPVKESIDHPTHYNPGIFEVINVIEAWELDFHLGNAIKYIARAGKKDPDKTTEDLQKAIWYIQRTINRSKADK